ncbi:glycosyltransferase family 2 protein [Pseudomonas citronellolis]|uniref:glycosyltransferase family 2 protein n=1 Tax=Pseudomonas citronellolis TaxID=53408 RepID=UPI00248DD790|nr:glycosyltransferase [Pseudomonas citronellolis]
MRLSVIIISWNENETLNRCLESLYKKIDFEKDEIILIDNGSTDGTTELIKIKYPKINYLYLPKNIGVGPARNRGIVLSQGRFIMTLDNDTIIRNANFGDVIESFYSSHKNAGVLGFRLLNPDETHQQSCRRFPGWLQPLAARVPGLSKLNLFKSIQSKHLMEDIDFQSISYPFPVDYVLGANQVFPRKLASILFGYDDSIFFGPEDFDFCFRAQQLGYKNYLLDDICIIHDYQRRTRKLSLLTLKHIVSYYKIMIKNKVRHF